MALNNGDLPYFTIYAIGVNPEQRVVLDFTYSDDTGSIPLESVVSELKTLFANSPDIDTVTAIQRTETTTEI